MKIGQEVGMIKKDILISQKYFNKDPKNFIKSILDKRNIKINNKPIIDIYSPLAIPKIKENVKILEENCINIEIRNIFLLVCNSKIYIIII